MPIGEGQLLAVGVDRARRAPGYDDQDVIWIGEFRIRLLAGRTASEAGNAVIGTVTGSGKVISNDGGSLISNDGGELIAKNGLISHDGGSLLPNAGNTFISHNGSAFISHNGGAFG